MRSLSAILLSIFGALLWVSAAFATPLPVAHARYAVVARSGVVSTGDYVFFPSPGGLAGILHNDRNGGDTRVMSPSECAGSAPVVAGNGFPVPAAGGGLLASRCGDNDAIYPLPNGPWRIFPVGQECLTIQEQGSTCEVSGVGRDWLAYTAECDHCSPLKLVQNLRSGAVGSAQAAPGKAFDLNAPDLESPLCSATTYPPPGYTVADGGFVIRTSGQGGTLVTKCGARGQVSLGSTHYLTSRPHLLLWATDENQVRALTLPQGREFALQPPRGMSAVYGLALGPKHIYIFGSLSDPTQHFVWDGSRPRVPAKARRVHW